MGPASAAVSTHTIKYYSAASSALFSVLDDGTTSMHLKVHFNSSDLCVIHQIVLHYNSTSTWNGYVRVTDIASGAYHDYSVTLPLGDDRDYSVSISSPYLMVPGDFEVTLLPAESEKDPLKYKIVGKGPSWSTHTYYQSQGGAWEPLSPYEALMDAVVAPVPVLEDSTSGSLDKAHSFDAYRVHLQAGKWYIIELSHALRTSYRIGLYENGTLLEEALKDASGVSESGALSYAPEEDLDAVLVVSYPQLTSAMEYNLSMRTNHPPVPVAAENITVNVNDTVEFNASDSWDPDGDRISYTWDFDISDARKKDSTRAVTTHRYSTPGKYTAMLTVSDGLDTCSTYINIRVNAPPTGGITIDGVDPYDVLNFGQNYTFIAAASDQDGDELTCTWDFGDGTQDSGCEVTHIFESGNRTLFVVTLTVSDGMAEFRVNTTLRFNTPPEVEILDFPERLKTGERGTFEVNAMDYEQAVDHYLWDFDGDGVWDMNSTDSLVHHTYKRPGNYTITVGAVDANGGIGTNTTTIEVVKVEEGADMTLIEGVAAVAVIAVVVVVAVGRHQMWF